MRFLFFCLLVLWTVVECRMAAVANEPRKVGESDLAAFSSRDWPWWRGPERNGTASADQQPPVKWSETENIVWKSSVPGRGHGSPIVVGHRIFLLTAEDDRSAQSVLCFERETGKQLWQTDVHKGTFLVEGTKPNNKSTFASSTVACDGQRIYANFLHFGAIYTTCLDLDGNQIWQKKITDYVLHQGFASSPAVYKHLVIISADNKGTGVIVALEKATGDLIWKHERPKLPNYASPIILHVAGKEQLIFQGCGLVTSYEPLSGDKLWEIKGSTDECVTSTVTNGDLIFTSGGYPKNHMSAVRADGSGKVAWENTSRVYVPSMLMKDGYLYAMLDAGVATCWKSDSGEEVWKERVGGTFSASPVLVGNLIFATDESGRTITYKASPEGFSQVAENQLGEEVFATPAICGSRIYMRAASTTDGKRQETLYCIGVK